MSNTINSIFGMLLRLCSQHALAQVSVGNNRYYAEDIQVDIEIRNARQNKHNARQESWWGLGADSLKFNFVSELIVRRKEKFFYLPKSSYAGLAAIQSLLVAIKDSQLQIEIKGGDASSCFKAIIEFKEDRVARRKVFSCEFPESSSEETNYRYNDLNN
jgi:hypothetical protein